jgi:serine protease Do
MNSGFMINGKISSQHIKTYLLYAVCCLLIFSFMVSIPNILLPAPVRAEISEKEAAEVLTKFGDAMAKVAEGIKPAVVNISTTKTVRTPQHPFLDDPLFRRFFGMQEPQQRRVTNLGSGVIASQDGYILTNNHVIEGAEDIIVRLHDNREYKGRVVGMDSRTDLAVIKIDEKNLTSIPWGDSNKLRVGEIVLAIGNPYGLNQTITMGIVSALGRTGIGITDYEDFIQTDAAINPGNSGGALVNIRGEIVGINTAIFSVTGGYQGIGFAIPSNMAKNVMDGIINEGRVVRGWLGVQIQALTPELARQFNLKDEKGVLLADVAEGGPAEQGGLRRGDIIIEYDGKRIETPFQLRNMVAATRPGNTAEINVIRNGSRLTMKVKIGELPIEPQTAAVPPAQFDNALRGVQVQELTEEILQRLGITRKLKGVVITGMAEDSPSLGILRSGDIILEINRRAISNVKEYNEIVSQIKKKQEVLLLIVRGEATLYLTISGR